MQINKETIEQLFRQHYLRMYQLARVLLKDDAASKDVVSEVFADVLDGKTQFRHVNLISAVNSRISIFSKAIYNTTNRFQISYLVFFCCLLIKIYTDVYNFFCVLLRFFWNSRFTTVSETGFPS